jgi:predicted secreted protein
MPMSWVSLAAVFFIIWWLLLFATLPFGLRTQDEDGDVTLGTTASAPRGPHMARAILRTTVVTIVIFAIYLVATRYFGLSLDQIPRIGPASR